jgi:hypothetical protein
MRESCGDRFRKLTELRKRGGGRKESRRTGDQRAGYCGTRGDGKPSDQVKISRFRCTKYRIAQRRLLGHLPVLLLTPRPLTVGVGALLIAPGLWVGLDSGGLIAGRVDP